MARYTATLAAQNTSVFVCNVNRPRNQPAWYATASATGDFGSGTVTWQGSIDGGSTKFDLRDDSTGTVAALTAAGMNNLRLCSPAVNSETLQVYATIAPATNPNISLAIHDNH